jgi:hypothetical protein
MKKTWYLAGAALSFVLFKPGPLAAQPPTTSFDLTGPVSQTPNLAGVVTSPYSGSIGGGPTVPVICDDFADDSYIPEQWTAYVTSLSQVISENTSDTYLKWSGATSGAIDAGSTLYKGWSLSQTQAYEAAALLAIDILNPADTLLQQQEYSFALWGLFDPAAFTQLGGTSVSDEQGALSYVEAAVADVVEGISPTGTGTLGTYLSNYNVTIYSYAGNASGPPPPQEFITVSMAEPSALAVLAFDLLGIAGLIFFVRRRLFATTN